MAVGWAQDGAVHDQIDATVASGVELIKSRLPDGESCSHCVRCQAEIPAARREAIPGVKHCVRCQSELESQTG